MIDGLSAELIQVIRELSFARELARVTEIIRTAARRLTRADGVTFVLKDDDQCFYADEDAIAPLWKGRRFPLDACVSGWVMTHGRSAVIADIYADPRVPHDAYRPTFVRSLAMVPVRTPDPVAAIGAYWAREHEATAAELAVLETLADSAALALTNVQLWSEKENAAARERAARLKAEEAGTLKDQFLATVSHELRTPLNIIQGWIWQLQHSTLKPEVFARAIDALDRNTKLQTRLVEDLLDTSRAVAGQLTIEPRLIDLGSTCRGVLDLARTSAGDKSIELSLQADPATPLIWGDHDRLQQIVWNLVTNAIKFSPRGGQVAVRVGRAANRAYIAVADNGIGVRPDFAPFMFDRFRQQDPSSTRSHNGLGIGLAIVRELVRLHGGTVAAESAGEGLGTTLTVAFPIPAVLSEPGAWRDNRERVAAGPRVRLDGLSILVVDDEADACEALRAILETYGAEVITARSGADALAALQARAPQVVLADLAMPEMDGFTFLQRARQQSAPQKHVPAAALTAFSGDEYQRRAAAAGFEMFLEKPIVPDELTARIWKLAQTPGPTH